MEPTVLVLIVVVALLVLLAAGVLLARRRRSKRLQEHYGPEYDRSLREAGDRRSAEAQLTEREQRFRELDVRELDRGERDRFAASWTGIQRGFVDDPGRAVHDADRLVVEIMRTRGYPVDDFERRAEDVSVEHPEVVQHYRDARAVRDATVDGSADTEQQRQAVTSYRALVAALMGQEPTVVPSDAAAGSGTAGVRAGGSHAGGTTGAPLNGRRRPTEVTTSEEQAR